VKRSTATSPHSSAWSASSTCSARDRDHTCLYTVPPSPSRRHPLPSASTHSRLCPSVSPPPPSPPVHHLLSRSRSSSPASVPRLASSPTPSLRGRPMSWEACHTPYSSLCGNTTRTILQTPTTSSCSSWTFGTSSFTACVETAGGE
jgi:hypothetical protein